MRDWGIRTAQEAARIHDVLDMSADIAKMERDVRSALVATYLAAFLGGVAVGISLAVVVLT